MLFSWICSWKCKYLNKDDGTLIPISYMVVLLYSFFILLYILDLKKKLFDVAFCVFAGNKKYSLNKMPSLL